MERIPRAYHEDFRRGHREHKAYLDNLSNIRDTEPPMPTKLPDNVTPEEYQRRYYYMEGKLYCVEHGRLCNYVLGKSTMRTNPQDKISSLMARLHLGRGYPLLISKTTDVELTMQKLEKKCGQSSKHPASLSHQLSGHTSSSGTTVSASCVALWRTLRYSDGHNG